MDALGFESAALVGHSQAGSMAVNLAFAYPNRISKVVVLGTGTLLPPLLETEQASGEPAEGREGAANEPTLDDARTLLKANLFHHELITDDEVALRHSMSIGKNFTAFVARGNAEVGTKQSRAGLWTQLNQCPVPLLMLYGREDRGRTAQRVSQLRDHHPTLNIHLLDGCKHLVQWDAAESFVVSAGNFLAE
jgi:2-hydroxy-6-oxonona-2,4-dienedioate hydrolase